MQTLKERFYAKVRECEGGCAVWIGSKYHGYGQFWNGQRLVGAHRISWEWYNGKQVPHSFTIDHVCQNPACVNPLHLQCIPMRDNCLLGSKAQNTLCPKGHLFDGRNVIWVGTSRMCRTCKQVKDRRYHWKNRERINARKRNAWCKAAGK